MSTQNNPVVPDAFAYQLRVDCLNASYIPPGEEEGSPQAFMEHIIEEVFWHYLDEQELELADWIVAYEIADSGKPHWQGILWFAEPLTPNNMSQIRNWFRKHAANTYQPVSFTKAIKPDTLASYVCKDGEYVTTLDEDQISRIPKWRDSLGKLNPKKKKELFESQCTEYVKSHPFEPHYYTENGAQCSTRDAHNRAILSYLTTFSSFYFKIYQSPIRRMSGITILLKLGILEHHSYISSLYGNFFR